MSSVAVVKKTTRELGKMLAPDQGWQQQVTAVHRKMIDPNNFDWAIPELSWNRVKSWFFGEARRIDYEERVAITELKAIEDARREHRAFVATTTRLAAVLAAEGASLSRAQMEVLDRLARRSSHSERPGE